MKRYNLKKLAIASAFLASVFLPVSAVFADGEEDDPGHTQFDGRAYFVWQCNGNKPCYHLFTNLKSPEQGVNYIENTEITDDSGNGINYVFKQKNADWVLPDDFNSVHSDSYEDYIGDEDKQTHGVTIQAIAFGGGNNSIATNEDWNFQVIIYRSGYKAITVGDNPDDYTYFPSTWEFNYNYYIDISDTSVSNPAVVTTYLKEPTIKIKSENILSMVPLNVNTDAVTVSKSLEGFDVKFNSSYYDHVTFDDFFPDQPHVFSAQVMYPTGTANGDTYNVIATVVDKDGNKKIHTLKSEDRINKYYDFQQDKEVSENLGKSYHCGKGLSCTQFSVAIGKINQIKGVYVNVIKANSASDVYLGTFSGSNLGTFWSSEARKVIYE